MASTGMRERERERASLFTMALPGPSPEPGSVLTKVSDSCSVTVGTGLKEQAC